MTLSLIKRVGITVGIAFGLAVTGFAQSAKQDMKAAGQDTKQAAKDTGKGVKHATKTTATK